MCVHTCTPAHGMSFSVCRRMRSLVWAVVWLNWLLGRTVLTTQGFLSSFSLKCSLVCFFAVSQQPSLALRPWQLLVAAAMVTRDTGLDSASREGDGVSGTAQSLPWHSQCSEAEGTATLSCLLLFLLKPSWDTGIMHSTHIWVSVLCQAPS